MGAHMTTAAAGLPGTKRPARAGWVPGLRGWLAVLPLTGLCTGLAAQAVGRADVAAAAWTLATLVVLGALLIQVVTSLARGDVGLDLVALLSMGGALALSQPLAGAVIALMYAGGQSLEAYATGRAGRAMTALLARQPRTALREEDGGLTEVPLAALVPGDRILVRVGDILPVDGRVAAGRAVLGPVEPHRRGAAGHLRGERARAERDGECRAAVHADRGAARSREHVCRASSGSSRRRRPRRRRWRAWPTATGSPSSA